MRSRKKFEVERENHERWLISYADFITLLFAFFVVMYAVSSVNQGKYKVLSIALGSAFGTARTINPEQDVSGSAVHQHGAIKQNGIQSGSSFVMPFPAVKLRNEKLRRERENMTAMALDLSKVLEPLVNEGKVHIIQNNRGIRIDIHSNLLFQPGSADLESAALEPLLEIAKLLKTNQHAIQVEGHTDITPIHNYIFFSNWELSAVRASSVVRLLSQAGVSENRLSAVGYGSAQPVSSNETEDGRAQNRRVSILVLYGEPGSATNGAEITPPKH
jgi:chemotaxis protein MotB